MSVGVRYASFDGDADRIVYYYTDSGAATLSSLQFIASLLVGVG